MTVRQTPAIEVARPASVQAFDPLSRPQVADRWQSNVRAADADNNVISILDMIGEDYWSGGGVTAKRVGAALRSIKAETLTVDINSPGGDFFEGVAIYNMLRQDSRPVRVRVLGLAASAASVIAMAGDELEIGRAGFLMVHNAWVVAVGNRHDLRSAAATIEPFDDAMAAVYAAKASVERSEAAGWMDAETWFNGERAVEVGLADALLEADLETKDEGGPASAMKRVSQALARQGFPRAERERLLREIHGGERKAAADVARNADASWIAGARSLLDTLKG
ncbi:head maturation protease, ClpP-related [Acuticoccus sediminis]|uniref:head maturation protease, ClpP-related n=1 Tax=Acuticoccus sediminis TaxID=2184697 RepID=UPI001CFC6913|nr:head maturation protease, ClpP-related [Acuticoccus sediminis]